MRGASLNNLCITDHLRVEKYLIDVNKPQTTLLSTDNQ